MDRELFYDVLNRTIAPIGPEKYAYISMGGTHLVDHLGVYRRAGIHRLYSFDIDDEVVARQECNRPFESTLCRCHSSGELVSKLDDIVGELNADSVVIWLDFTSPRQRLSQLQEIQALVPKLNPGDILRITLNADLQALERLDAQISDRIVFKTPNERWAERLRQQLGAYVPSSLTEFTDKEFASVLSRCVANSVSNGLAAAPKTITVVPILLTAYQDTSMMLSVTMLVRDIESGPQEPVHWPFAPSDWSDVFEINAPDLSAREKVRLDHLIHKAPADAAHELGFMIGKSKGDSAAVIESYAKLRRYYPSFFNVEA